MNLHALSLRESFIWTRGLRSGRSCESIIALAAVCGAASIYDTCDRGHFLSHLILELFGDLCSIKRQFDTRLKLNFAIRLCQLNRVPSHFRSFGRLIF